MAKKVYHLSHNGDKCDSKYERDVVDSLIERGIRYEFKPEQMPYEFPIQGGYCPQCFADEVLQHRLFGPDLILRDSGVPVEIKGKWSGQGYPHKRNLATYVMRKYPYQIAWIFTRDSRIAYNSKTTNTMWAHKYRAIDAATGIHIPERWASPDFKYGERP